MSLDSHALTSVAEVLAYIGEDAERDALWLYFTSGTNTVQVNDNSLVLVDADNGTTTIDLTAAANNTLTELVTVINAVTGWECGLIYHGSADSSDLVITGAVDAEGEENEQTLKIKDNYLIERLIERATDFIERYCERLFNSRDYSQEVYYGKGYNRLILEQYPVTTVSRLAYGRANSFNIRNTSTDANFCTVEVTSTVLHLVVDGGTNDDDTDLTLASYASIDELITAITALGKGWSCTTSATDTSYRDASELLIRPSMNVTAVARAYCETFDGEVTEYKLISPAEARNFGVIEKPGIFSTNTEYFVSYTAGYSTIPYSLEQACIELVKYKYDLSKQASGLKAETIGNVYSYQKFSAADLVNGLPAHLKSELETFVKREF